MKPWLLYAILGAVFAGLMPVFVKRGLVLPDGKSVDSNLATAIRIIMLVAPVWMLVWYQGRAGQVAQFSAMNWLFLALSAAMTGLSWLLQFKALQYADVSRVMPIDKFSLVIAVVLGAVFLGEAISVRLAVAVGLIVAGTILAIPPAKAQAGAPPARAASSLPGPVEDGAK